MLLTVYYGFVALNLISHTLKTLLSKELIKIHMFWLHIFQE